MQGRAAAPARNRPPASRRLAQRFPRRPPPGVYRRPTDPQAGFTFIEIMVAVMILFILIGFAGFTYVRYVGRAREVAAKNQIQILALALNSYYMDCGSYPTAEQGLEALWEKPILEPVPSGWSGPYLDKAVPKDPWGRPYEYRTPGPNNLPYGIRTLGADGMEGGDGGDRDISSWEG